MTEYNTASIAKRLNVHDNTIRDWTRRYAIFLSDRANNPKRKYTDDDLLILATVADYRDKGISFEAITDALQDGKRIEPDAIPPAQTPDEEEARENVELVTVARDTLLIEQSELLFKIDTLTQELETVRNALDSANTDKQLQQQRIVELERDLATSKAQLEIVQAERKPSQYWMERERQYSTYWFAALAVLLMLFFVLVVFVVLNMQ